MSAGQKSLSGQFESSAPPFCVENNDKLAESHLYERLRRRLCAPLLSCFTSNFLISDNKRQDRYTIYDEFKSSFGNFLIFLILPLLHFGQQVMSMPVKRSIISQMVSLIFSGKVASGSINFRIRGISSFLLV